MKSNDEHIRSVQINAFISPDQRELLKDKAGAAGMTYSKFLAALIEDAKILAAPVKKKERLKETNAWLGRINSNLNMISKHANAYKDRSDTLLIIYRLDQIKSEIEDLIKSQDL